MGASTGSLETSADSRPPATNFSFSTTFSSSFSDLLNGIGEEDGERDRAADRGVPKFKSAPPPSLPLSPPLFSPSSYFAIPPGMSPTELLDSPVLLSSSSHALPSPTTGSFPVQSYNWNPSANSYPQQPVKEEQKPYPDFSFQTLPNSSKPWNYQEAPNGKAPNFPSLGANNGNSNYMRESKRSDDGYNWRKYGQKQVKGSENPRSYYKCTFPSCPTKKKVERSLDGQITEIIYKGKHNHPKPQSTRRNSSGAHQIQGPVTSETSDHSFGGTQIDSGIGTPENSSVSLGDDDADMGSQRSRGGGEDLDDAEPDAKRWKGEGESEEMSGAGNRTSLKEPRVVIQTTSDIDILDDGFRWRKYGQKVVKGNPNPRSYYKCTTVGCPVRKHVERASNDLRSVITTYEGKHNHDVPAARGSGISRPAPMDGSRLNGNSGITMAIRPSAMANHAGHLVSDSLFNSRQPNDQSPFALEMLQASGAYGFSGYDNVAGEMTSQQTQGEEGMFQKAKEEPKDDLLLQSMLF